MPAVNVSLSVGGTNSEHSDPRVAIQSQLSCENNTCAPRAALLGCPGWSLTACSELGIWLAARSWHGQYPPTDPHFLIAAAFLISPQYCKGIRCLPQTQRSGKRLFCLGCSAHVAGCQHTGRFNGWIQPVPLLLASPVRRNNRAPSAKTST